MTSSFVSIPDKGIHINFFMVIKILYKDGQQIYANSGLNKLFLLLVKIRNRQRCKYLNSTAPLMTIALLDVVFNWVLSFTFFFFFVL